ncbi:hypothetical protein GCM10011321_31650 [Youhaiella tibetensis]|uniref:Helix-turn-helix domain-containing protein n=1 Tax=Paradevosia tibetensis TaxID=1447062 RepID=A0A5B9DJ71_9HYPH|nr:helix-turn-helix domain-containing protein [Youhaiella tibetensis]QEE18875.1 helix-turn-helix domain-containing protein [Youhaiella tibetensis]GGF38398.1 hypothetical protein GCM10011321_31650 [Youhaiella tibetensis]
MTLSAAIVRELVAAGLAGRDLVAACERIEAADAPGRSPAAVRQARYRARQRELVASTAEPVGRIEVAERYVTRVTPEPANSDRVAAPAVRSTIDKHAARRGVNAAPGLSPSARRVAHQLIDHFNRETGRCDPSHGRLAGLCGLSERSVRRAVAELDATGLIERRRHGGRYHANAYAPDWGRLVALDNGRLPGSVTPVTQRPVLATEQARIVRQTHIENLDSRSGYVAPRRARRPNPAQREMLLPVPSSSAAREAAHRRLWDATNAHLRRLGSSDAYAKALAALTEQDWDRGTDAELRRQGSGLAVLLAGTGPPIAATG